MIEIIITTENKEQVNVILGVLEDAEGDGVLDFPFSVKTERVETNNDKPDPIIPEDLQEYADHVGLDILYRNYHKSTNGIWSKVDIKNDFLRLEKKDEIGYTTTYIYDATIRFGCQDGEINESYCHQGYFSKKLIVSGDSLPNNLTEWSFSYLDPREDQ